MKKKVITILACLLFVIILKAQPPRDTTHRDTTMLGFTNASTELMRAPVLRRTSNDDIRIVPNRQQFCFDALMEIELHYGGRYSLETCLFINTTDGYIGYTTPSRGGAINMLFPEIEHFRFTIISFKLGNVFTYFNQKSNHDVIAHYVTTSNTDTHEYQMNNLLTTAPLTRKSDRRTYCDGNSEALAYKRSDEPTAWYLFGSRYPATIQAQKFLGAFGVGVVQTDAGPYIVMERTAGATYTVVKHIEKAHICFDPSGFKMQEADFYAKRTADLQAESTRIDEAEAAAQRASCCVPERMAEIAYRRQQLQVNEENLRRAQQGNLLQDRTAQKGIIDMMDPLVAVRGSILSIKTSICTAEDDKSKNPSHTLSANQRISCLNQQLSALQTAETQMQAAETRYAANPAQANAEKSRIYMTVMRQSGGCD
ncbi:MAG: hypothetical protein JST86_17080 [Bacteroidetes bacterium]|nr:hypothetical protein [Bacteroidota bacterium]